MAIPLLYSCLGRFQGQERPGGLWSMESQRVELASTAQTDDNFVFNLQKEVSDQSLNTRTEAIKLLEENFHTHQQCMKLTVYSHV